MSTRLHTWMLKGAVLHGQPARPGQRRARRVLPALRVLVLAATGLCVPAHADPAPTPAPLANGSALPQRTAGASLTAMAWHTREGQFFKRNWGVDIVGVHPVSSGYMLAFRYKVLDPVKASVLNDARAKAFLIDEASGATLAVPAMENVGELRQTSRPVAEREYFIVFGNPGRLVRPGGLVSVVVGSFRADGLVVE